MTAVERARVRALEADRDRLALELEECRMDLVELAAGSSSTDPDVILVPVRRHRDSDGKSTCYDCDFDGNMFCSSLNKTHDYKPLTDCPLWKGETR